MSPKKRVAFFIHGGIGNGYLSQGFPLVVQIIHGLRNDFDITVFSLAAFDKGFTPEGYVAYSVPRWVRPGVFRWLYLVILFLIRNTRNRYPILYSFWGYPMGFATCVLGSSLGKVTMVNILGSETANLPEINYGFLRNSMTRKLVLWTCNHASELIAVSHYQIKILKGYGLIRNAKVIPWGSDRSLFFPKPKVYDFPFRIVHVANLNEVKDQETLIKAFKVIRDRMPATLRIVGPDFMKGKIQQLVIQLGLERDVEFLGVLAHTQIPVHYHWAHAFMLTSLSEGQNNSIGEAMLCGVFPASTAVGIMDELRDIGIVVEPRDFERLGIQLAELYLNKDEWERRRQQALAWSTKHDLNWTVARIKELLNQY